jgi:sigma-B regulation protein RsbQ
MREHPSPALAGPVPGAATQAGGPVDAQAGPSGDRAVPRPGDGGPRGSSDAVGERLVEQPPTPRAAPSRPDHDGAEHQERTVPTSTLTPLDVVHRNNVVLTGDPAGRPLVLAHGFGCDQGMWRHLVPSFTDHRVVLFDHVGSGGSDWSAYDRTRYDSLDGYAADLAEILDVLDLRDVVLVAHSVSAMIGVIAATQVTDRIGALVLVGPSPRYVDEGDYVGGFAREDIEGLLLTVTGNLTELAATLAPAVAGADRPDLEAEVAATFCRNDPEIARHFAEVTFLSDNRRDLAAVQVPTLVVQCSDDAIAPAQVGAYVHRQVPGSRLVVLDVHGHSPHLSHPQETSAVIRAFLDDLR